MSSPERTSSKRDREDDIEIVIRIFTGKRIRRSFESLTEPKRESELEGQAETVLAQSGRKELDDELVKIQTELNAVQDQLHETMLKWMDCEVELRREQLINEIAQSYIPEERLMDFHLDLPSGQPRWETE